MSRAAALLAAGGAATGCIVLPPNQSIRSGRGVIDEGVVTGFARAEATRADVLLRLGEPSQRRDGDRVYTYDWEVQRIFVFAAAPGGGSGVGGGAMPLGARWSAAIRFDERGVVTHSALVGDAFLSPTALELEKWIRATAPASRSGAR